MAKALVFAFLLVHPITAAGDVIAFFYALDADLQGLKTVARELGQSASVGTRSIQRLRLGSHTIHAVKMGSGAVETAASAQALLARNRCDWAFSLGPAGALAVSVATGSWYKVSQVIAWQHGSSASASPSDFPTWVTDWSKFTATNAPPPLGTASHLAMASGEQFISTTGDRDRLQALTQADAVDMNGYGLALVCADHGVPLFSWKVVSDRADETASETFKAFIASYSGEGGKALAEVIRSLPPNLNDPSSYPAIERALRE
jgi:nucleoside phosphorylase